MPVAMENWRWLLVHAASRPFSRAFENTGIIIEASIEIMAITTRSSINVKPCLFGVFFTIHLLTTTTRKG
jgi:hypothetical protein